MSSNPAPTTSASTSASQRAARQALSAFKNEFFDVLSRVQYLITHLCPEGILVPNSPVGDLCVVLASLPTKEEEIFHAAASMQHTLNTFFSVDVPLEPGVGYPTPPETGDELEEGSQETKEDEVEVVSTEAGPSNANAPQAAADAASKDSDAKAIRATAEVCPEVASHVSPKEGEEKDKEVRKGEKRERKERKEREKREKKERERVERRERKANKARATASPSNKASSSTAPVTHPPTTTAPLPDTSAPRDARTQRALDLAASVLQRHRAPESVWARRGVNRDEYGLIRENAFIMNSDGEVTHGEVKFPTRRPRPAPEASTSEQTRAPWTSASARSDGTRCYRPAPRTAPPANASQQPRPVRRENAFVMNRDGEVIEGEFDPPVASGSGRSSRRTHTAAGTFGLPLADAPTSPATPAADSRSAQKKSIKKRSRADEDDSTPDTRPSRRSRSESESESPSSPSPSKSRKRTRDDKEDGDKLKSTGRIRRY